MTANTTVNQRLADRVDDIRKLLDLYYEDGDAYDDELGNLYEYGLDLRRDEEQGCIQYLLSTGGPHDELQFWGGSDLSHVLYVFKDWGTYETVTVWDDSGHFDTLAELYAIFIEWMPQS